MITKESASALGGGSIDWALASKQHAGYVDALSKIVDAVEVGAVMNRIDDVSHIQALVYRTYSLELHQATYINRTMYIYIST